MQTQTPTSESVTQTTPAAAKDLGELPFAEYEAMRRSGASSTSMQPSAPADQSAEQKAASDSETEEAEDVKAKDAESLDDSEDSDQDKPAKKKGGWQRRIDKVTAEKSEARREAEYWKKVALENKATESNKPEASKQEAKAGQDGKPNPDNFETHAEYVESLTDWKTEQKLKERDERSERAKLEAEQKQKLDSHFEREKAFAEKTDDYREVLEEVDYLKDASVTLGDLIVNSENGPELMYELAKNKKEFERINSLSPVACAREIGRLEARLAKTSAAEESNKPEPKKITKAPKPIEPVGGSKGTVAKSISDPDLSFADYEKLRRQQLKRR